MPAPNPNAPIREGGGALDMVGELSILSPKLRETPQNPDKKPFVLAASDEVLFKGTLGRAET